MKRYYILELEENNDHSIDMKTNTRLEKFTIYLPE